MRTFLSRQRATLFTLALIAMLGVLNACTVTTTGSQTDAITRPGGWVFESFSTGTPTAGLSTAYKGMTVVFTSSGSVTFTTAAEARAAGAPATYTGTWSLTDLRVMSMTVPGLFSNGGSFDITELTSTAFRFSATSTSGSTLEWKWTAK